MIYATPIIKLDYIIDVTAVGHPNSMTTAYLIVTNI